MVTEIVVIYLLINSFFIWMIPNIGGYMMSGREYSSFVEFSNYEIFIIMCFGVVVFLFSLLPLLIIGGDDGYV